MALVRPSSVSRSASSLCPCETRETGQDRPVSKWHILRAYPCPGSCGPGACLQCGSFDLCFMAFVCRGGFPAGPRRRACFLRKLSRVGATDPLQPSAQTPYAFGLESLCLPSGSAAFGLLMHVSLPPGPCSTSCGEHTSSSGSLFSIRQTSAANKAFCPNPLPSLNVTKHYHSCLLPRPSAFSAPSGTLPLSRMFHSPITLTGLVAPF